MITRIEVKSTVFDTRASIRLKKLQNLGFSSKITKLTLTDVYTIDKKIPQRQLKLIALSLSNPVTQKSIAKIYGDGKLIPKSPVKPFSFAIEIGFLPGVTDNVANTAKEIIEDLLKIKFVDSEGLYTSQITFVSGEITQKEAERISLSLSNSLIHRIQIKSHRQYIKDNGMDFITPKVKIFRKPQVLEINLDIKDTDLEVIGKQGILDTNGTRRGPLALDLDFMKTIKRYFLKKNRKPTDIELEALAQTWSEHCKHTIFADPIDEIKDGVFRTYIQKATEEIRRKKGKNDFCESVFSDNSGAIAFTDKYLITHKIETHNTPSALDPFGGSITGIVGVNRDTIGFGLGAKPIANFYGFCFADPMKDTPLYKGSNFTQKMLSSRRIMDGVIEGVNAGGNQSGIPTPSGFIYFDERYRGKPLVFVGTIGLIPRKIKSKPSFMKKAKPGDYIVMVGGRVGKDGIHGATFSSEPLDSGSPVTAVQIGDPITQKKFSDAVVKEARDQLLYHSITDNGAGGLSCSVAEMAKESGGCEVDLEKVPLKYPGLDPWEIWISESQERMTLSIAANKWEKFSDLMKRRGVEATVIGKFTDSGRCTVKYQGRTIMDIDLQFLHYGLPHRKLKTRQLEIRHKEPKISLKKDLSKEFVAMLGRENIASYEFITQQYDHLVQANLALSPLQGKGRINAPVSIIKPLLSSFKGVILSCGLYPTYSDIDTYHMAGCCIDTAIRNIITSGGEMEKICLLDNFCWCSGNDPFRLWQLKKAAKACYDYACVYQTPFISGKDSMFNDFAGFDAKGNPIKISIPPTLLITSLGLIEDVKKSISLDVKLAGDLVYLLGDTFEELGASEYFSMINERDKNNHLGNNVPKVDSAKNLKMYRAYQKAASREIISSGISLGRGGLSAAIAKTAMGGRLGLDISLKNIPGKVTRDDFALFSESQGRILVTIDRRNKQLFERIMLNTNCKLLGEVTDNSEINIKGLEGNTMVKAHIDDLLKSYRSTFEGF